MLDGLILLLTLSVIMALASFLAGALPLSMTLTTAQLRLISSIGMGVLVGTSLVVIIPEGIDAMYSTGAEAHIHKRSMTTVERWDRRLGISPHLTPPPVARDATLDIMIEVRASEEDANRALESSTGNAPSSVITPADIDADETEDTPPADEHAEASPTFYIGLSLVTGFVLMFLIDKLPQHASDNFHAPAPTRHISLDNLSQGLQSRDLDEEESESFLQSFAPTPKQSRSLATTTGLVIHAAADGIAMGASASTANAKLGFLVFIAILVHKAPAAFGLTSVLLRQGLSKRATRGHLIVFSLAAPVGALTTWFLAHLLSGSGEDAKDSPWWTGMLLLFSAGTFLYVAMHAMQEDGATHEHPATNGYADAGLSPRKQTKPQMRDTLATVVGMLIPLLTQIGHH